MSNPTGHHYKPTTIEGKPMTARKTPHAPEAVEKKPAAAWEYRVYYADLGDHDNPDVHSKAQDDVNELGADGWELVGVAGGATWTRCFFKRPVSSTAPVAPSHDDSTHEVASEEEG